MGQFSVAEVGHFYIAVNMLPKVGISSHQLMPNIAMLRGWPIFAFSRFAGIMDQGMAHLTRHQRKTDEIYLTLISHHSSICVRSP